MPIIPLMNPKRPPKQWWKDCVSGVQSKGDRIGRPYSICGSLWYHKMSAAQRRAATKRHEKRRGVSRNASTFIRKPQSRKRWYVGPDKNTGYYVMFQSEQTPTQESHGHKYSYSIGPFSTALGAKIMAHHGKNNPHLQTVSDAEFYARKGLVWLREHGFHV